MALFGFGKKETTKETVEADFTIKTDQAQVGKLHTGNMTQEQLKIRRTNVIEGSKFGRPAHESFMLFLLKIWLIIGPIAFVALTTSEVAYILIQLVPPGDTSEYVITGGALFIDIAMMFVTFGVAIKRRDLAEKREANGGSAPKRDELEALFGTIIWLVFAIINMISQCAFLLHIIGLSNNPGGMTVLYVFVASRVVGFILGDASTAFFLARVDNSEIKLIARAEREKGALYSDIARAEGERSLIEARAEADMRILQIEVQQKEAEARFMAALKQKMFDNIIEASGASSPGLNGPNRSRVHRLDSST
jgi:uncharacterized membrane protein